MNEQARAAVRAIYEQVDAPGWAAPNLDGLADVLRDLSWLPGGTVTIAVPPVNRLDAHDRNALLVVLEEAAEQSRDSAHPIELVLTG